MPYWLHKRRLIELGYAAQSIQDLRSMRLGSVLIWVGAGVLLLGVLLRFFPTLFSWFGNLPGDIRVEGESTRVFIPITSMIVVSVVLTVIANLVWLVLRHR